MTTRHGACSQNPMVLAVSGILHPRHLLSMLLPILTFHGVAPRNSFATDEFLGWTTKRITTAAIALFTSQKAALVLACRESSSLLPPAWSDEQLQRGQPVGASHGLQALEMLNWGWRWVNADCAQSTTPHHRIPSKTFWGGGNVLFFVWGGGYKVYTICENTSNWTPKICAFYYI